MDSSVGDFLLDGIRTGAFNLIADKGADLFNMTHTLISSLLTCSIVIYGVRYMLGDMESTNKNLFTTCVWVILAIGITEPSSYFNMIVLPILQTKDNLAIFFISNRWDGGSLFSNISDSFSRMFGHALALIDSGSFVSNFTPILAGLLIGAVYGVYYFLAVSNMLLCELILMLLMFFGLLILPLSGFQLARGLAKSWIVSIIKYALISIITTIIISLLDAINKPIIQKLLVDSYQNGEIEDGILSPYMGLVLVIGGFGVLLMRLTMEIAAEISGGVMSDGMAASKMAGSAAGAAISGIGAGAKYGAGGALKALKAAKELRSAKVAGL
ncbi:hypothetical protein GNP80_05530 [Aliivibrio fischeri]|uniref:type IV secretion system protein n=1 Tax=Aliivibrio fischeri TaxID=668 RepID=UPI0012D9693D|nr:type IV secretion system protein [Aliivibrio fischeri]MUK91896.1 hypothetical protein [Aliivibrio fischeri]